MSNGAVRRPRRARRRAAIVLFTIALVAAATFVRYAGRLLVVQDPLQRADVIFVLAGARAERWLEGVDLYKEKWAPRIVLSPGPVEGAESELRRRGIVFPSYVDLVREATFQLGVPPEAVTALPESVDNTAHEAARLRRMAIDAGWRRIIVVTSKYHTRRTRFAFQREFRGSGIVTIVRASRYDQATPERWWRDRENVRWVTSELPKLLLYRLGLRE